MTPALLFASLLLSFSVYSYALIDPNFTLADSHVWTAFRNVMVQIGYHDRPLSWGIYLGLLLGLFVFHWHAVRKAKLMRPMALGLIAACACVFAYPFLSHDLFNYMFDAKILTFYGHNPYLHRPIDYPDDTWLRFMHWTHRTYPYGPVFLLISAVPSFLGMGKLLLHFLLIKMVFAGCYLLGVWAVSRFKKEWAVVFATHPLIIVEGLINAHNEIVAVGLGLAGLAALQNRGVRNAIGARILFAASAGIKFMTVPYLILARQAGHWRNYAALAGTIGLIWYASYAVEVQQWYFLNLMAFLPLFPRFIANLWPLSLALLMSYYPLIYLGSWQAGETVRMKFVIIQAGIALQIIWLVVLFVRSGVAARLLRGVL